MRPAKKQFIQELKPGLPVDDIFYLTRRDIKERRDGQPFLTFTFQDRSGTIAGIMWDGVQDALKCLESSGFYHVQGKFGDYQGKPQLTVTAIYPAALEEVRRDDFVTASRYDRDEMLARVREYAAAVKNPHLRQLLDAFFTDAGFVERFANAPGGAAVHHACIGGLLEHTLFMCRMAETAGTIHEEINADLLMTGVILHDIGKVREYTYDFALDHTWDGRLLGHIVMGYEMVREKIAGISGFPEELARMLLHIILAHHGHMEFGSPKTPKFAEAFIVYFLDNMDARVAMFRDATNRNKGVKWTDYHHYLETNVYIPDPEPEPPDGSA
ncbi:MAG: HD domain-containing protein [bacterium]